MPFGNIFDDIFGRNAEPEPKLIYNPHHSHLPSGSGTGAGFPLSTGTGFPGPTGTADFSMLPVGPVQTPSKALSISYDLAPTSDTVPIPTVGAEAEESSLPPFSIADPSDALPPASQTGGFPATQTGGFPGTGLPGFPTGFPTGLPSGFPTGFPSGFPTASGSFPFPTTFGTVVRGPIPTPPPVPAEGASEDTWKSWWQQWIEWLQKWTTWGKGQTGQNDQ